MTLFDTSEANTYSMCMQDHAPVRKQRMLRKQIFVTSEQERRLKELSLALERPEGELIREALSAWMARTDSEEAEWKSGLLGLAGIWSDYPDIDEVIAAGRRSWDNRRHRR